MKKAQCQHEREEMCTNTKCPYCADYCPCYEHQSICKYSTDGAGKAPFEIFDKREVYKNCTVEIWENTKTGAVSVGWYGGRKQNESID